MPKHCFRQRDRLRQPAGIKIGFVKVNERVGKTRVVVKQCRYITGADEFAGKQVASGALGRSQIPVVF